ncbi:MAG: hypothetical protein DRI24_23260 [Deltaproteobacteria bacterium]|nr:MAG: hypothetical protein DRI24_23260 [Deltaproteobacteria bacterium]
MKFIKHIGKHADRRVAIIYRVVPDEHHMCLVAYPDTLPTTFHDAVMQVIESDPGQQAKQLSDALFRNLLPDGRPILETLHREGMIKKVPTNQIVVTPNAQSHVRLDELNKILDGIEAGDEAAENMKKLDEGAGLVSPNREEPARKINEDHSQDDKVNDVFDPADLSDKGLANQRAAQAAKLASEAKMLIAESQRLQEEAWDLNPELKPAPEEKKAPVKKKVVRKKAVKKKVAKKKAVKKPAKVDTPTESTSAPAE